MAVVAYLRVSTEKQFLENQREEIIRFAEKNVHIPGHTRSLSGSILRHKISLKSAILYPFIP